jgi:uncharacterized protein YceK
MFYSESNILFSQEEYLVKAGSSLAEGSLRFESRSTAFPMKIILVTLCYVVASGCSTIHTINNAEAGLVMKGSYCKHIDHILSGIEYNWCKLHGTPNSHSSPNSAKGGLEYVAIDSAFSFFSDLIVLPYTVYKQLSSERIAVRSTPR